MSGDWMETIFLIIDESGAKGYSDKQETYQGEVGVMAGYLIPEKYLVYVQETLENIKSKYFSSGKVHIADLSSEEQASLRSAIYEFFIESNIICISEAVHSQGFYDYYNRLKKNREKTKESNRSNIKTSSNTRKESLHECLFQGIFSKGVAFCIDQFGYEFRLNIITDRVDDSIKQRFTNAAEELLNVGEERVKITTGFDPSSNTVVKGSIVSNIENAKEVLGDYSKIKYSINYQDSGLTLAADVIANSLNYHFKNRPVTDLGENLNDNNAMQNYPLLKLMYGIWDSDEVNYVSDAVFMHPENGIIKAW